MQEKMQTRIDISTAGSHHKAFQRSQTHRCIDALTVFHSGRTATISEMGSDHLEFFNRPTKSPGQFTGNVLMAGSVKPITADTIFRVNFRWNGVVKNMWWQRLMKSRIEDRHLRFIGK